MAKGRGGSSATSATRIKRQKKVAASLGIDLDASKSQPGKPKNKERTGRDKKDGKKEPRVKGYVPPVKPARAQPDPLDVGGLGRRLPPELVVVLKNISKKAEVTKVKALEELGSAWVEKALRVKEQDYQEYPNVDVISSLVEMTPAWVSFVLEFSSTMY
jgi:hypothetical protein